MNELIWCGDSAGYSGSFTLSMAPYTRFKASGSSPGSETDPVVQHLNHQRGILSLLPRNVNFNSRAGVCKLSLGFEDNPLYQDLSCMSLNCNTNNDLVIGGKSSLFKVDLIKGNASASEQLRHDGGVSFMRTSLKFLVLGKSNGSLETFDPLANTLIKTFHGHNGLLSDLDVLGNYAATCGYSLRPLGRYNYGKRGGNGGGTGDSYLVDPLVNIYDFRMMRPLSPIPFPAGAAYVRFHPKLPNIIIIASTTGQIQFVDIYDHLNVSLYQADLSDNSTINNSNNNSLSDLSSYMANLDISSNGEFLLFSDAHSNLHLWSFLGNDTTSFNTFPNPLEQPDLMPSMPQITNFGVDDMLVPLSAVGLPYYKEHLLSHYPTELKFVKELAKLPIRLERDGGDDGSEISARSLENRLEGTQEKVFTFQPYHGPGRNLELAYHPLKDSKHKKAGKKTLIPLFLSERRTDTLTKTLSNTSLDSVVVDLPTSLPPPAIFEYTSGSKLATSTTATAETVPNCYTKLQIQYSRFGVEDFDFDYYNKSPNYSGLENHLDNSYINSLLQLYRYSPQFYNMVTQTLRSEWLPNDNQTIITDNNPQGSSLLNELGYLFDMTNKAQGKNVTISNLTEQLNMNQDASKHHLLNFDECKTLNNDELRVLIINFNKFFNGTIAHDQFVQHGRVELNQTTGVEVDVEAKSLACGFNDKMKNIQFGVDLTGNSGATILSNLSQALNQFKSVKCQQCLGKDSFDRYHLLEIKQTVAKLPPILLLNLNFTSIDFEQIQRTGSSWLVPSFFANPSNQGVMLSNSVSGFGPGSAKYNLLGYVCAISHGPDTSPGEHNLVSYVKIDGSWYLFNDFLVMPIPEEEVFDLSKPWKRPVVVMYTANAPDFAYLSSIENVDTSILYRDHFAGTIREGYKKEYQLLSQGETPVPGSLVAIDAEFVTLEPEELEIWSTGLKNIIKPRKLSLARISVLHGDNGPNQGVPFIDDYIVHTREIDDYLTSFSGIEPGDLDPVGSTKNLVTLQTAYRRLWLLLNMGCVFVGHGLYNDFRCINLQVPKHQIKDTGEFYYLPEYKRKLSLKFLAYVLLREKVQTGNHDSIEDAHTALLLYKKYIELKAIGDFENTLYNIYMEGQQLRFRVPDS